MRVVEHLFPPGVTLAAEIIRLAGRASSQGIRFKTACRALEVIHQKVIVLGLLHDLHGRHLILVVVTGVATPRQGRVLEKPLEVDERTNGDGTRLVGIRVAMLLARDHVALRVPCHNGSYGTGEAKGGLFRLVRVTWCTYLRCQDGDYVGEIAPQELNICRLYGVLRLVDVKMAMGRAGLVGLAARRALLISVGRAEPTNAAIVSRRAMQRINFGALRVEVVRFTAIGLH